MEIITADGPVDHAYLSAASVSHELADARLRLEIGREGGLVCTAVEGGDMAPDTRRSLALRATRRADPRHGTPLGLETEDGRYATVAVPPHMSGDEDEQRITAMTDDQLARGEPLPWWMTKAGRIFPPAAFAAITVGAFTALMANHPAGTVLGVLVVALMIGLQWSNLRNLASSATHLDKAQAAVEAAIRQEQERRRIVAGI